MSHEREQAAEILEDLMQVCRKHKCILLPGNGVFYLARPAKELNAMEAQIALKTGQRQQAVAIATIREINPGMSEWQPVEPEVTQ
jgi:hypothetical protein